MILLSFLSWTLFLILSLLPMASKVHFGVDVFFLLWREFGTSGYRVLLGIPFWNWMELVSPLAYTNP